MPADLAVYNCFDVCLDSFMVVGISDRWCEFGLTCFRLVTCLCLI